MEGMEVDGCGCSSSWMEKSGSSIVGFLQVKWREWR